MITIVRGSSKLVVTRGAYEEQYKKLGYQIASENKGAAKKVAPLLEKKEEKQVEESSFKKDEEEDLSEKFGLKTSKKKGK
jgi:hypothetical protein